MCFSKCSFGAGGWSGPKSTAYLLRKGNVGCSSPLCLVIFCLSLPNLGELRWWEFSLGTHLTDLFHLYNLRNCSFLSKWRLLYFLRAVTYISNCRYFPDFQVPKVGMDWKHGTDNKGFWGWLMITSADCVPKLELSNVFPLFLAAWFLLLRWPFFLWSMFEAPVIFGSSLPLHPIRCKSHWFGPCTTSPWPSPSCSLCHSPGQPLAPPLDWLSTSITMFSSSWCLPVACRMRPNFWVRMF